MIDNQDLEYIKMQIKKIKLEIAAKEDVLEEILQNLYSDQETFEENAE